MKENQPKMSKEFRKVEDLRPHPDNPRVEVDEHSPEIVQLSENIARRGIIQPLVITPGNVILAGHRRLAAAKRAGLTEVPVSVREIGKHEFAEEIFISENMERQDLSPLEEARAIHALHLKLEKEWKRKVNIADLARRLDMPNSTVSVRLAILDLTERVQKLFHLGEIPLLSARQLARLKDAPVEQEKFADKLVTRHLDVKSLPALISKRLDQLGKDYQGNTAPNLKPATAERTRTNHVLETSAVALTRGAAVANLQKNLSRTISLSKINYLLDSVCCSCGMMGNDSVCISCPLPRFVNGIVGRADGAGTWEEGDDD